MSRRSGAARRTVTRNDPSYADSTLNVRSDGAAAASGHSGRRADSRLLPSAPAPPDSAGSTSAPITVCTAASACAYSTLPASAVTRKGTSSVKAARPGA